MTPTIKSTKSTPFVKGSELIKAQHLANSTENFGQSLLTKLKNLSPAKLFGKKESKENSP